MSLFRDFESGGVSWQVHPDLFDGDRCVLLSPEGLRLPEWLAAGHARLVKRGADRTVYRVALPGIDFYLKHYHPSGLRARFRGWLRPGKARMEFHHALTLAERGVPTPDVLALGETVRGVGPDCSYLITRMVPETLPLGMFLETTFRRWPACRQTSFRQRLAVALGRFLARMHDAGVTHSDLHPGNLLLRLTPGDNPELYLIDLHAVRCGVALDERAARAGLVALNRWFSLRAERSDRLRFWRAYQNYRDSFSPLPRPRGRGGNAPQPSADSKNRPWRRTCASGSGTTPIASPTADTSDVCGVTASSAMPSPSYPQTYWRNWWPTPTPRSAGPPA